MIKYHVVLPFMFAVMIKFVVPCGVFEDYVPAELTSVLCVASCFSTVCRTCELASVLLLKFWSVPQAYLRIAGDPKFPSIYLEKKESFILNLFFGVVRGWFEVGILEMPFCRQVLSTVAAAAAASLRVFFFSLRLHRRFFKQSAVCLKIL